MAISTLNRFARVDRWVGNENLFARPSSIGAKPVNLGPFGNAHSLGLLAMFDKIILAQPICILADDRRFRFSQSRS